MKIPDKHKAGFEKWFENKYSGHLPGLVLNGKWEGSQYFVGLYDLPNAFQLGVIWEYLEFLGYLPMLERTPETDKYKALESLLEDINPKE